MIIDFINNYFLKQKSALIQNVFRTLVKSIKKVSINDQFNQQKQQTSNDLFLQVRLKNNIVIPENIIKSYLSNVISNGILKMNINIENIKQDNDLLSKILYLDLNYSKQNIRITSNLFKDDMLLKNMSCFFKIKSPIMNEWIESFDFILKNNNINSYPIVPNYFSKKMILPDQQLFLTSSDNHTINDLVFCVLDENNMIVKNVILPKIQQKLKIISLKTLTKDLLFKGLLFSIIIQSFHVTLNKNQFILPNSFLSKLLVNDSIQINYDVSLTQQTLFQMF
jgi:hypothetical protein